MTQFPPNPLVTALAESLLPKDAQAYVAAQQAVQQAQDGQAAQLRTKAEKEALDLADKLATDPTVPPLVTFAGFLGGNVVTPNKTSWRVFYLDAKLLTWLLVSEGDIINRQLVDDETAPFGLRDVIWLSSSASVTEGTGPPRAHEIEAQFLRGDFIGAGDFSAAVTGGTFARATGLLCEVQTPGCCGKKTR